MSVPEEVESMPPKTAEQEDVVTAEQCRTLLLWEVTQGVIAVAITGAVIANNILRIESQVLVNAFFLIVGSYFSRVNFLGSSGTRRNANDGQQHRGRRM